MILSCDLSFYNKLLLFFLYLSFSKIPTEFLYKKGKIVHTIINPLYTVNISSFLSFNIGACNAKKRRHMTSFFCIIQFLLDIIKLIRLHRVTSIFYHKKGHLQMSFFCFHVHDRFNTYRNFRRDIQEQIIKERSVRVQMLVN